MEETPRTARPRRDGDLVESVEGFAVAVGRIGYGLLRLPLALLPTESRRHMENAIRELSYGFAALPADFAAIAGAEVERWAAEAGAGPPPHARPHHESVQHLHVEVAPLGAAAPAAEPQVTKESTTGVGIAHIEFDPPGSDRDGEYVLIRNTAGTAADLTGWSLSDGGARHRFVFPRFSLGPGAEVRVWTGRGSDDGANLYWGNRGAIWNNSGDTGTLSDAAGAVVSSYSYEGGRT